jgi:hypothetical protein
VLAVIADADDHAARRFLEFFAVTNPGQEHPHSRIRAPSRQRRATVAAELEELIPMAATPPSPALYIPAPDFRLPGTDGQTQAFDDIAGENGTVIVFICNHCP